MVGKSMTEGTPWKHIIKFALPVLAGSLLQQLYNTVDTIIVGNFASQEALSAVGTTGSFTFFFLAIATGFSAGNGVVVSQFYGAGDEKQVRSNASTGILMLMIMGIVSTLVSVIVAKPVYKYFVDVPDNILGLTLKYFLIYAIGLVFQYGYNIFSAILRAVGDSVATLYFLMISSVINIILDLLFVAVFNTGVIGAAVATVIAQFISFVAAYFYMVKKYPIFRFKIKEYKLKTDNMIKTLKVGFPIALQLVIVSFGLTFIQRAVNQFGETMTASFTVGQRIEMYLNLPCNAFQTTLATFTGQNIGAGKVDRVKKGMKQTMLISLVMTLCISGCVWFLSRYIGIWFGLEGQALDYCMAHLRTIAFVNVILSSYVPVFGVFQGANHPMAPTFVATGALGVRVLVTYLLRYSAWFGYTIIWWNGLFGFGIGFIITWSYFLSGKWQRRLSI